jgi:hypothetical protein
MDARLRQSICDNRFVGFAVESADTLRSTLREAMAVEGPAVTSVDK